MADPRERRLAIIKLHVEGWTPTSIAGYLGTSRQTVYTTLKRWIEEQFAGLPDRSSRPNQPATKVTLQAMQEVKKMQVNPELGISISNPAFCTLSNMGGLTDLLIWLHKWIEEKSGEVGRVHPLAQSFLLAFHHECSSDSPGQFICLAYTFRVSIC